MTEQTQATTENHLGGEEERLRAVEALREAGLLSPFPKATYHGRVGSDDQEPWRIDPDFNNGGDDTGHLNVNERPTLYTGEKAIAWQFAKARLERTVKGRFDRWLTDKLKGYSDEDRQEWLNRVNARLQAEYESLGSDQKKFFGHMLGEDGRVTPQTLDDLNSPTEIAHEIARLSRDISPEERAVLMYKLGQGLRAEVYEIVADDDEATVLDMNFDPAKLDPAGAERYKEALAVIAAQTTLTEGGDDDSTVAPLFGYAGERLVSDGEAAQIAEKTGANAESILKFAGAYNARLLALKEPQHLVRAFLDNTGGISFDEMTSDSGMVRLPIDLDYARRYLDNLGVVGVEAEVDSATLSHASRFVSIFNLQKVHAKQLGYATFPELSPSNR